MHWYELWVKVLRWSNPVEMNIWPTWAFDEQGLKYHPTTLMGHRALRPPLPVAPLPAAPLPGSLACIFNIYLFKNVHSQLVCPFLYFHSCQRFWLPSVLYLSLPASSESLQYFITSQRHTTDLKCFHELHLVAFIVDISGVLASCFAEWQESKNRCLNRSTSDFPPEWDDCGGVSPMLLNV